MSLKASHFAKKFLGDVDLVTHTKTKPISIFIPSSHNSFNTFENEAVQFWKVYYDFAYYTLLIPFRFAWDPDTGYYFCQTNKLQRVFQFILCSTTTCYFLFNFHMMSQKDPKENPTLYFELAYYFFDTTFLVLLFLLFGRQMKLVDEVFRELQFHNKTFYKDATNYKKTRMKTAIILIGCLGTLGLQILETLQDQNWSIAAFVQFWQDDAATVFKRKQITDAAPLLFAFLSMTSSLFEKLLNAFSDILFTMTVLLFNNLVGSFVIDLQQPAKYSSPIHILEHYWWLKKITEKINTAMSLIIGAFIAGNLPFYATNVFDVFGDANIFMRLRYMFYCCYFFPSLFIAAKASRDVENIKEWVCLEENFSRIPLQRLNVFLHEVENDTVGVCSFGILTVTWQSVGSIISIILTYALLKSQFSGHAPPTDNAASNHTDVIIVPPEF